MLPAHALSACFKHHGFGARFQRTCPAHGSSACLQHGLAHSPAHGISEGFWHMFAVHAYVAWLALILRILSVHGHDHSLIGLVLDVLLGRGHSLVDLFLDVLLARSHARVDTRHNIFVFLEGSFLLDRQVMFLVFFCLVSRLLYLLK